MPARPILAGIDFYIRAETERRTFRVSFPISVLLLKIANRATPFGCARLSNLAPNVKSKTLCSLASRAVALFLRKNVKSIYVCLILDSSQTPTKVVVNLIFTDLFQLSSADSILNVRLAFSFRMLGIPHKFPNYLLRRMCIVLH